jgi:hypothetical protein
LSSIPRNQRTPETEVDILLTNLSFIYGELYPNAPEHEFINTIYKDLYLDPVCGDVCVRLNERFRPTNEAGIGYVTEIAALSISCAYCIDALNSLNDGELNESWSYIVDAGFWFSKSSSKSCSRHFDKEKTKKTSLSRLNAQKARYEKYYSKQYIFVSDLFQKTTYDDNKKTTAAKSITPKLIDYIEKNNLPVEKTRDGKEKDWYRWVYELLVKDF